MAAQHDMSRWSFCTTVRWLKLIQYSVSRLDKSFIPYRNICLPSTFSSQKYSCYFYCRKHYPVKISAWLFHLYFQYNPFILLTQKRIRKSHFLFLVHLKDYFPLDCCLNFLRMGLLDCHLIPHSSPQSLFSTPVHSSYTRAALQN